MTRHTAEQTVGATRGTTPVAPAVAGRRRRPKGRRLRSAYRLPALLMLGPAVIALLAVGIYPAFFAVNMSLHSVQLTKPYLGTPFVGLANYATVLGDPLFWGALGRTAIFFLITVPIELVAGIALALLLDGTRWQRLAGVVRILVVLPLAVTPTVVGLVGRLLFNRDFGVVNWMLGLVGLGPVSWLGEPIPAMVSIALTDVWQWTPFFALVALGGLTMVPTEVTEAVRLETNSRWQMLRHAQLPYLLPGIAAVLIIRTIDVVKLFDMVFTLTRGGPGVSTELISLYVQRIGFRVFDMGVASAQAVILLVLSILIAQLYVRFVYREVEA
ncbi:MAG TPA: sugar ABC transporter permease [Actinopolymorphaceae bacterium]